ncbi:MAG: hypothetical protein R3C10_06485 [Pirellulales bacterium]
MSRSMSAGPVAVMFALTLALLLAGGHVAHAQFVAGASSLALPTERSGARVVRYQVPTNVPGRYYAPRFDGSDAPGPLIITPGQIVERYRKAVDDVDRSAAGSSATRHSETRLSGVADRKMEYWVLQSAPARHALTAYQPPLDNDANSGTETFADNPAEDAAEDAPPAPAAELFEPTAPATVAPDIDQFIPSRMTTQRTTSTRATRHLVGLAPIPTWETSTNAWATTVLATSIAPTSVRPVSSTARPATPGGTSMAIPTWVRG